MRKVITYGTFDLFHQGHINLLRNAKKLGDYLIVGVTSESYDRYRGKLNVQQPLLARIENVRNSGLADEILVEEYEGQKIDDISHMEVDVFAIGSDWLGRFDYLKKYCEVIYLERTKGISSTMVRNIQRPFIQFGVVGAGRIANRFITETKFVSGVNVEGVFHPKEASAQAFACKHGLSYYTDKFASLLRQVNAVYIASPHLSHYQYAKQAIEAGRHVLCEKPMVLCKEEADELFHLAAEHQVILCEAIKTAYCPGFQRLISCAQSGKIGEIKYVDATFTKLVPPGSRELDPEQAGGSVTELATYPLLAIIKLLGSEYEDIQFTSYQKNVDLFTKIDFRYRDSSASAKVGIGVKSEGELIIAGTRGYIYVPAPWWKTEYFELRFENTTETEKFFYKFLDDGLRYEIVEFVSRITNGGMDKDACETTSAIAHILGLFRKKIQFEHF